MPGYKVILKSRRCSDIERLYCMVCDLPLRDPKQTECGHWYCDSCLYVQTENGSRPMQCKALDCQNDVKYEQCHRDGAARREVMSLTVYCENRNMQCSWEGKLKELEKHLPNCEFSPTVCIFPGCWEKVAKCKLQHHMTVLCEQRVIFCEICHKKYLARLHQKHMKMYHEPASGTQKCNYSGIDCHAENVDEEHYKVYVAKHLELIAQEANMFAEEMQHYSESDVHRLAERVYAEELWYNVEAGQFGIGRCQQKISNITNRVDALIIPRLEPEDLADKLKEKIVSKDTEYDELELSTMQYANLASETREQLDVVIDEGNFARPLTNITEQLTQAENNITSLERQANQLDSRLERTEQLWCDGKIVWRITNFSEKRQAAISGAETHLQSQFFYTSPHGYKMAMKAYLNGDGSGAGSHLSLYLAIYNGPYDAILKWPFTCKVTFELCNQTSDNHIRDAYKPDPTSASFQRPRNNANVASGCPCFALLSEIDTPDRGFVVDDIMFLRGIVDIKDIVPL